MFTPYSVLRLSCISATILWKINVRSLKHLYYMFVAFEEHFDTVHLWYMLIKAGEWYRFLSTSLVNNTWHFRLHPCIYKPWWNNSNNVISCVSKFVEIRWKCIWSTHSALILNVLSLSLFILDLVFLILIYKHIIHNCLRDCNLKLSVRC